MKIVFSLQIFEKLKNIKFHEYPSFVAEFHMDRRTDRWTDLTKLIDAFRSFAKAPKKANQETCMKQKYTREDGR